MAGMELRTRQWGRALDTMQTGHVSSFQARFLTSRDLVVPTGEPLYSYRMTRDEFGHLEFCLKEFLTYQLKYVRFGELVRDKSWLPALFVLYSAEWWRREYDGSGWSWEPIVSNLGADPSNWTPSQRSHCVEAGLTDWKISVAQSRGFRFLGSVALQGGLPMKLLAAAQGNIGSVLSRVLRLAADSQAGESEIEEWIRSLSGYLPDTYRQAEIYRLLTQIINSVLALKANAALDSAEGAITKLDAYDSNWRQKFPLPIEDDQARGLIEQLVKDVATVRVRRSAALAQVERRIEVDEGVWRLRSSVVLPEYAESAELLHLFSLAGDVELPRSMVLRFGQGRQVMDTWARRLAGRDTYRIDRRLPEIADQDASGEHVLSIVLRDGTLKSASFSKGEILNGDLPWLFNEPEGRTATFVRQGSGAVAGTCGVLCIPIGWKVEPQPEAQVCELGLMPALNRAVLEFKGAVRVFDPAGASFKCKSGQAAVNDEYLGWAGTRGYDVDFLSPPVAFRGSPKLSYFSEQGILRTVAGSVLWKSGGRTDLSLIGLVGPVEAIWPAHGDTQWRSRIILLGDAKAIVAKKGETPLGGELHFANWNLAAVNSTAPDVDVSSIIVGDTLIATFRYTGVSAPPEWCDAELLWRSNPNRARVRVPFPALGARCFDSKGRQFPEGGTVSTETLFGIRLVAFLASTEKAKLRLVLCDGKIEVEATSYGFAVQQGQSRVEVRPVDHLPQIRRMLADADSIDAFVRVELYAGNSQHAALRVARYACELSKCTELQRAFLNTDSLADLTLDELASLSAVAIRLDAPGEEPILLERYDLGDLEVGWTFPVPRLEDGPWLVYPGANCPLFFRPLLWTIGAGEDVTSDSTLGLTQILRITDVERRSEQLKLAIKRMSGNFSAADWHTVEQLADQLYSLPFCTLDLWREFGKSRSGLAALAFRAHRLPSGFLERFSSEMPAVWERIALLTWVETMRVSRVFEELQPLPTDLANQVEAVASLHHSLRVILEVAKTILTRTPTKDVAFALQVNWDFTKNLFEGGSSPYQKLLRDGANAEWPTELQSEIQRARGDAVFCQFFRPVDALFRDSMVNLPILLAASAATGIPIRWAHVQTSRTLRRYQDFCPDWFADAFDLTVACCLSKGLIRELES